MSSGRSECSTSLSFSSPTPSRRSYQRRTTLPSGHFAIRSGSCSPFRVPLNAKLTSSDERHHHIRSSGSPATSISSGLGRSFSPASAHSYPRPRGNLNILIFFLSHWNLQVFAIFNFQLKIILPIIVTRTVCRNVQSFSVSIHFRFYLFSSQIKHFKDNFFREINVDEHEMFT